MRQYSASVDEGVAMCIHDGGARYGLDESLKIFPLS